MKRIILFLILFSMCLSACNSLQPIPTITTTPTPSKTSTSVPVTPTPTLTLVESAETWESLETLYSEPGDDYWTVSPNGQWLVKYQWIYDDIELDKNQIISIEDPSKIIDIKYDIPNIPPKIHTYRFHSWSPDSTAFVGIYTGEITNGDVQCCGDSIAITNFVDGNIKSYVYRWGWKEEPFIYWSFDSSKIVLVFRDKGIWILNRTGESVSKIDVKLNDFLWTETGIYGIGSNNGEQVLYNINIESRTASIESKLDVFENIFKLPQPVSFIGYDKSTNNILLAPYFTQPAKIIYFNLDSHTISKEKIVLTNDSASIYVLSSTQCVIAIQTINKDLWLYDCKNQTKKYYGHVFELFGWFQSKDGFLVNNQKIIHP